MTREDAQLLTAASRTASGYKQAGWMLQVCIKIIIWLKSQTRGNWLPCDSQLNLHLQHECQNKSFREFLKTVWPRFDFYKPRSKPLNNAFVMEADFQLYATWCLANLPWQVQRLWGLWHTIIIILRQMLSNCECKETHKTVMCIKALWYQVQTRTIGGGDWRLFPSSTLHLPCNPALSPPPTTPFPNLRYWVNLSQEMCIMRNRLWHGCWRRTELSVSYCLHQRATHVAFLFCWHEAFNYRQFFLTSAHIQMPKQGFTEAAVQLNASLCLACKLFQC